MTLEQEITALRSGAWPNPSLGVRCSARSGGTWRLRTAPSARWPPTCRASGRPKPSWPPGASGWRRRAAPTWRRSWETCCDGGHPPQGVAHPVPLAGGRGGDRGQPGARSGEFAGLKLADVDSTRTCCWCWARAAAGGRCRSAARPHWRWTVPEGSRPSPAGTDGLAVARQEGGLTASGLAQMLERRGRQAGLPRSVPLPAAAHVRAQVARGRQWRNGPDAPGWLEVPRDVPALRGLSRRHASSRGPPPPSLARRPTVSAESSRRGGRRWVPRVGTASGHPTSPACP